MIFFAACVIIMHVVLELLTGDTAGRSIRLVGNQVLDVGSSSRADFVVSEPPGLAEYHFSLATDLRVCRLRHLGEGLQTLLNGQPVSAAVVRNGDRLRAGGIDFLVHVEGDAKDDVSEVPANQGAGPSVPPVAPSWTTPVDIQCRRCDSGATCYEGPCGQVPPGRLAARLASLQPMYAVVDFRRLPESLLPKLESPDYLFDWLGQAAVDNSPVILGHAEADLATLVEQGWATDGVVSLFSSLDKPCLVKHLREATRPGSDRLIGICWPNILSALLERYEAKYVMHFLEPLSAVLLETNQAPESWLLFAKQPLDEMLDPLGLRILTEPSAD